MNKSQQKGKAKRASLPSSPSSSSSSSSSRSQESGSGSGSGAGSGQAQGSSVCRFFASTGGCWRGGKCKFQHIAPPPDTHSNTTTTTTPAYSDKQCMICYENPDTFALFLNCDHIFCLSCAKAWRESKKSSSTSATPAAASSSSNYSNNNNNNNNSSSSSAENNSTPSKTCPVCRAESHYIVPSSTFPTSPQHKLFILNNYKQSLAKHPCRYFEKSFKRNSKKPTCPFGDDCLYAHNDKNGTRVLNVKKPPPPRSLNAADNGPFPPGWPFGAGPLDMHMLMHMLGHDSAVPSVGHDFYHDEDDGSYECVECWEEHPPWMTCEDYEQEIAEERGGYYCDNCDEYHYYDHGDEDDDEEEEDEEESCDCENCRLTCALSSTRITTTAPSTSASSASNSDSSTSATVKPPSKSTTLSSAGTSTAGSTSSTISSPSASAFDRFRTAAAAATSSLSSSFSKKRPAERTPEEEDEEGEEECDCEACRPAAPPPALTSALNPNVTTTTTATAAGASTSNTVPTSSVATSGTPTKASIASYQCTAAAMASSLAASMSNKTAKASPVTPAAASTLPSPPTTASPSASKPALTVLPPGTWLNKTSSGTTSSLASKKSMGTASATQSSASRKVSQKHLSMAASFPTPLSSISPFIDPNTVFTFTSSPLGFTTCVMCTQPFTSAPELYKHLNLDHMGRAPCNMHRQHQNDDDDDEEEEGLGLDGKKGTVAMDEDGEPVPCEVCTLYHCFEGRCHNVFYETVASFKQHRKLVHSKKPANAGVVTASVAANKSKTESLSLYHKQQQSPAVPPLPSCRNGFTGLERSFDDIGQHMVEAGDGEQNLNENKNGVVHVKTSSSASSATVSSSAVVAASSAGAKTKISPASLTNITTTSTSSATAATTKTTVTTSPASTTSHKSSSSTLLSRPQPLAPTISSLCHCDSCRDVKVMGLDPILFHQLCTTQCISCLQPIASSIELSRHLNLVHDGAAECNDRRRYHHLPRVPNAVSAGDDAVAACLECGLWHCFQKGCKNAFYETRSGLLQHRKLVHPPKIKAVAKSSSSVKNAAKGSAAAGKTVASSSSVGGTAKSVASSNGSRVASTSAAGKQQQQPQATPVATPPSAATPLECDCDCQNCCPHQQNPPHTCSPNSNSISSVVCFFCAQPFTSPQDLCRHLNLIHNGAAPCSLLRIQDGSVTNSTTDGGCPECTLYHCWEGDCKNSLYESLSSFQQHQKLAHARKVGGSLDKKASTTATVANADQQPQPTPKGVQMVESSKSALDAAAGKKKKNAVGVGGGGGKDVGVSKANPTLPITPPTSFGTPPTSASFISSSKKSPGSNVGAIDEKNADKFAKKLKVVSSTPTLASALSAKSSTTSSTESVNSSNFTPVVAKAAKAAGPVVSSSTVKETKTDSFPVPAAPAITHVFSYTGCYCEPCLTSSERMVCVFCNMQFQTSKELCKHLNLTHEGKACCNHWCDEHRLETSSSVPRPCRECSLYHCYIGSCRNVFFESASGLEQHQKLVHGTNSSAGGRKSLTTTNAGSKPTASISSSPPPAAAAAATVAPIVKGQQSKPNAAHSKTKSPTKLLSSSTTTNTTSKTSTSSKSSKEKSRGKKSPASSSPQPQSSSGSSCQCASCALLEASLLGSGMFGGMSGDNVAAAYGTAAAAAAAGFWSTTNCMKCSQPFETTQALSKHLNLVHSGSAPCNIVSQAGGGGSDTAVVQCQECTLYHCRAGDCKDVFYETSLALKQHHKLVHGFNHNGGSNTTSNSSSNKASAGSSRPSSATAAPTTSATTTSSSSPPEGEYEIRPGVVIHPYIMDSNNGKLLGSENPKEDTPVGSPVFIFGLMSESGSRLNGKSGILCGYKTDKQRFIINVDGEKDVVLVKAKNLVLLK